MVERVSEVAVASKVVLVDQGQSGQDYRLCVNFVDLNAHTVHPGYPMQDLQISLDACRGFPFFSIMDLKAGYHNIPASPETVPLLGIYT